MALQQVYDSAFKSSNFFQYIYLSIELIFAIRKNEVIILFSYIYTSMDYISPLATAS